MLACEHITDVAFRLIKTGQQSIGRDAVQGKIGMVGIPLQDIKDAQPCLPGAGHALNIARQTAKPAGQGSEMLATGHSIQIDIEQNGITLRFAESGKVLLRTGEPPLFYGKECHPQSMLLWSYGPDAAGDL